MQSAAAALDAKIAKTHLADSFKKDFHRQVAVIQTAAGCAFIARTESYDCSTAALSKVEKADADLAALSAAVDAAVKTDGTQTLAQLFAPKIAKLSATLAATTLAPSDKATFQARIEAFQKGLGVAPASALKGALPESPESAQASLDALAANIAEAVALIPKGQTLLQDYNAKQAAARTAILTSKLAQPFHADFLKQLDAIDSALCAGASRMAAKDLVGTGKCFVSMLKLEDAVEKTAALSDAVAAAVKTDGSKSLSALYQPKIAALRLQIAKIDAQDQTDLKKEIDAFAATLAPAPSLSARTPEAVEAAYEKTSGDVAAAVELAKTQKNFVAALDAKIAALQAKVAASKLNAAFKTDFANKLTVAIKPAGCDIAALARQMSCKGAASASAIAAVEDNLAKLSDDVAAAIKADGTQSLSDLYAPKVEKLSAMLAASKVDAADLTKLTNRIKAFTASLKAGPGGLGKGVTVDSVADAFSQLTDDVQAAIDLSVKH
jgi:hypothetical protein